MIIQALSKLTSVEQVILFGSEARQEARADSDIDLLVLLNKNVVSNSDNRLIIEALYPVELETLICINPIIRSSEAWSKQILTPLKYNIQKEGKRLL